MLTHYNVVNNGKMHWGLYGPFYCRSHDDSGANVSLLWYGAFHDLLSTHGTTMCPYPISPEAIAGLY
jgi:hypothetical protein